MHLRLYLSCFLVFLSLVLLGQKFDANAIESIAKNEACAHITVHNNYAEKADLRWAHLNLRLDPENPTIQGNLKLVVTAEEPLATLTLDVHDNLSVLEVQLNGQALNSTQEAHQLRIDFLSPWEAGDTDTIEIDYSGAPTPGDRAGMVFTEASASQNPAIYTLSQPYGAREWWPVRQQLGDRFDSIEVTLQVPEPYSGISIGMPSQSFTENGVKTTTWKHGYSVPPYLVSVAVAEYDRYVDSIPLQNGTLPYINYLFKDQPEQAEFLVHTKMLLPLFESLTSPYPYQKEKYGHTMWYRGGGMEHPTNSSMGNFSLDLQAHELAHMWFGDMVTCASWQDIWLNEGFATYFNGLAYEFGPSLQSYWPLWKRLVLNSIIEEPDGSVYVYDTTSVSRVFDSRLSYRKAAYVLHMLRWQTDTTEFFDYLYSWLEAPERKFGFASTEEFKFHMENASGKNLTEFFNDWVYQQGHPSYQVFWGQNPNGKVEFELYQRTSHSSVDFFEMKVPVRFYSASGDSVDVVFDHEYSGQQFETSLPFQADRLVFDPDRWLISSNNEVFKTKQKNALLIYPNPAQEFIQLVHPAPDGAIFSVQLLNLNGQTVKTFDSMSFRYFRMNVSDLPNGSYRMLVNTANGRVEETIVIY